MAKLWTGVTAGKTDPAADDFNSSIRFDQRMFRQDIAGSIAHASMLAAKGILSDADCIALTDGTVFDTTSDYCYAWKTGEDKLMEPEEVRIFAVPEGYEAFVYNYKALFVPCPVPPRRGCTGR